MFRRRRDVDDFAEEIEAHLALETERLEREGLSRADARAAAQRAFGNVTRTEERFFESRRWVWWDQVIADVRYGARMLRNARGFTVVAVVTIALGIGATTAIFTVVDATLLHPLPYERPDQLVTIEDDLPGAGARDVGLSEPEWQDLQRSGIFEYVSPTWFDENNLTGSAQPERVGLLIAAPNYFALLGVKPQLGSTFNPDTHAPGLIPDVVISDGLWKRAFGRDPQILDKSIRLDTDLYRIIGVMPAGFRNPGRTTEERNIEVWAATSFYGAPLLDRPFRNRRNIPGAIARLKPGLTIAAAQSRVDALVASVQQQFPGDYPSQSAWTVRLLPLKDTVVGNVRQSLLLLLGAVVLVLLIGCVNVANLLLARASARSREIAVRQALGAARTRLIRQLLTESVLLSAIGGAAGLAMLWLAQGLLVRLVPDSLPRLAEISISRSVLSFAVVAIVMAGGLFGLAPALHAGRLDVVHMLKREGRGSTATADQARTRRVLAVTQFAVSLVLLVAAGLLLRSFWDLLNVRLGFNPENVVTARTRLPYPNDPNVDAYRTVTQQTPFFRELLRRARTLGGVEEVALGSSTAIPLEHGPRDLDRVPLLVEGRDGRDNEAPLVLASAVTPEYFHLMGISVVRGRLLSDFDNETAHDVAVVNESIAREYWPGDNAVGKHLNLARTASSWTTVVGVVADARTESLENASVPHVYISLYQKTGKHLAIFLRGRFDTGTTADELRRQVQALDPNLPVFGVQPLRRIVSTSLAQRRFSLEAVGLFALTALMLAGLGIYGVVSYMVSERTHEIGLRLVLGAQPQNVLRMVLVQGMELLVPGVTIGIGCALIVSHAMSKGLYGVRPTDLWTFVGVTSLLVSVALVACYIPARRAVRVDPAVALRCD